MPDPPRDHRGPHSAAPDRPDLAGLADQLAAVSAKLDALSLHLDRPPDQLLTVEQVADRLQVGKRTVERIVSGGKLRPLWIEGQRRFTTAAVDAYLRDMAKSSKQGAKRKTKRMA
ncbi:MAG: helix-turn-helix domain-containing protein [Bacteroidota bacterium]